VGADVRHLQAQLDQLRTELGQLASERHQLSDRVETVSAHAAAQAQALGEMAAGLTSSQSALAIDAFSRFIRHACLVSEPLVSVVLPTYERPDRLRRAVQSVIAQRYTRWELLVVDDGGEPDSRRVVEETEDPRVRWMRIEHGGVCAARNAALAEASGELIAYLDDDNVMDVDWLYSVVWGFEQRPEVNVLYGAIVIDDVLRIKGSASGDLPRIYLNPWDRAALRVGNLADIGAIAHRAGLSEAHFDETLQTMGDWDLLVSLTAHRDPLVLPAVACYYTTDTPVRLTGGPSQAEDEAKVKARAAVNGR
jgi:Glycosyl transferase family 2